MMKMMLICLSFSGILSCKPAKESAEVKDYADNKGILGTGFASQRTYINTLALADETMCFYKNHIDRSQLPPILLDPPELGVSDDAKSNFEALYSAEMSVRHRLSFKTINQYPVTESKILDSLETLNAERKAIMKKLN